MEKFNLFKMFSPKPINKDDEYNEAPTDFKGFFVMLGRKFWNLSNLNLLFVVCNFPIFFYLYTLTGQLSNQIYAVGNPLYPAYYGMITISKSPELLSLAPFVSRFVPMYVPTTACRVFQYISLLAVFTFALTSVGSAYVIRGYNRGDPIFMVSDFFGAIKRNWKQGLIVGIMDIVISFLLVWDFIFWNAQSGFANAMFYYASLFLGIIYFFMRYYIYTLLITFNLSIPKIFKNAFIFAFLGLKRNLLALVGVALVLFINVQLFYMLPVLGILLPLVITFSLCNFITGYASYPVIKKYMIDPYYSDNDGENDEGSNEESIFVDRG